eukprot:2680783-Pyramimonas_sp.AAC.1
MLAGWRELEGADDLAPEFEVLRCTDSQPCSKAAVEHATGGLGHRPREWPPSEHPRAVPPLPGRAPPSGRLRNVRGGWGIHEELRIDP